MPLTASAEDIRTSHAGTPQKAWRLLYRTEDQSLIEFIVWPDYVKVTKAGISTIYDFKLKRVIQLSEDGNSYFHSSLYMMVGFRASEYQNRGHLTEAVSGTDIEIGQKAPTMFDPFWRASDLGHMNGPLGLLGAQHNANANGGFTITYKGVKAVEFEPAKQKLDTPHHAAFYRALRHLLVVQPAAQKLMVESQRPPGSLKFKRWEIDKFQSQSWSLETIEQLSADYPLGKEARPDFQLLIEQLGLTPAFKSQIVPFLRDVVSDNSKNELPRWADYRTRVESLIAGGNRFDAGLLLMEFMIRFGGTCQVIEASCREAQELIRTLASDERFRTYFSAFALERQDREQAVKIWSSVDRTGLRHGYMLDIALGNALQPIFFNHFAGGTPENISQLGGQILGHFQAALKGNALNSSTYKDLGDFYYRQFRPSEAWLLWDLGRNIDEQFGSRNTLGAIDQFETRLETDFPAYFR